jgi:cysteinyl-tRNA synthetase
MEDYFGYDVSYHINITDVDDKIILRARQEHLYKQWHEKTFGGDKSKVKDIVLLDTKAALDNKTEKLAKSREKLSEPLPADAGTREVDERESAIKGQDLKEQQLAKLKSTVTELTEKADYAGLAEACAGELGELVDSKEGHLVSDHEVFNKHSRKFELAYLTDMEALGVRPPDVMTRVTEYVPQIVDFVKAIVDKGLAYDSNGSVYLSIDAFKAAGHTYRKLKPFAGDTSEADMAEGEGAIGTEASDKKNKNDFALWKASKPGEPSWESPWGSGRPGWHIECSVIASDILGPNLDVHAGGVDLKFPHHDNELAQSEAYFGHNQWVNYFFHAGHLDIKGLKMSKSLKNFITIQQALEKHSARQIRLMFLLQPWDKRMNYSDQTMADSKAKEAQFRNFFGSVKAILSATDANGAPSWLNSRVGWRQKADKELMLAFNRCTDGVHDAFCNNFDTPAVIHLLVGLVKDVNNYLISNGTTPAVDLIRKCAMYVTKILRLLGVIENDATGFPLQASSGGEEALKPFLDTFRDFRQEVRGLMRGCKDIKEGASKVLAECDKVRDEALPKLGVRLEDLSDGTTRWKLDDPQVLMREIEGRKAAAAQAQLEKKAKDRERAAKKLADITAASIPPSQLFQNQPEFGSLTADGLPATLKNGDAVNKSQAKKYKKQQDKQAKDHEKFLAEAKAAGLDPEALLATYADKLAQLQ